MFMGLKEEVDNLLTILKFQQMHDIFLWNCQPISPSGRGLADGAKRSQSCLTDVDLVEIILTSLF